MCLQVKPLKQSTYFLFINILLLLDCYPGHDCMRIVGRWYYKLCTEAKETLGFVPILIFCYIVLLSDVVPPLDFSSFVPSLLPPILVYFCRCWCLPPGSCQVYTRLLPQTHPHPWPRCSLCLLTQFQKRLRSYQLRDRVLPSPNVFLHCLKYCLLSCRRRRGAFPFSVCP